MTEFFKMDVFFVVTTVIVIVAGVLVCIGLYYVIRILRNVERISEDVEGGTKSVRDAVVRVFKKRS
jgi:hypothetical protein